MFTTAGIRFSVAASVIYLWARASGESVSLKKGEFQQVLILSFFFAMQLSLYYFGLSKSNASRGTLLGNLQPFFVLFLSHYLLPGERITHKIFLGILIGFSGVVFVFLEKEGVTAGFRIGDIVILFASFFWACHMVYAKRILKIFSPIRVVFYSESFAVPFFFLQGFFWDRPMIRNLDPWVIGSLFYQCFVTASFGFVIWNMMLQRYGAVELHSFVFIIPIAGVFFGWLLLGEPITYKILLALALIVSGILMVNLRLKMPVAV